jgi:phosphoglycolate phosphatase
VNIVFDLDGTLINSKLRLYRLFQTLATETSLSYEEYWVLKKAKTSNSTILSSHLGYDEAQIADFLAQWMSLIEAPSFLALDSNFEDIHSALGALRRGADLHICTARQLRESVMQQLVGLNLLSYFDQVLVTERKYSKEALISANVANLSANDWLVGDTGKDIQVGKSLNMKTCAVLSGFLNESVLKGYGPNLILDSVIAFRPPTNTQPTAN